MKALRGLLPRILLAGVLLLPGIAAPAERWHLFESEFDEEKKPWSEIEAQLPAYPRPENLIPFDAGAASFSRFYVDAPSISVGADGVVRYTLLIRGGGGATNVSFEGIRCQTHEQKLYAVGRNDGKWVRARDPAWRDIAYKDINRYHWALFDEHFCVNQRQTAPLKTILESLKRESFRLR